MPDKDFKFCLPEVLTQNILLLQIFREAYCSFLNAYIYFQLFIKILSNRKHYLHTLLGSLLIPKNYYLNL
jgi:hypothetical protein